MITKRERKLSNLMIFIQVLISIFVFLLVELLYPSPVIQPFEKAFFLSQIAIIWSVLFYKFRLGVIFRVSNFLSMIRGYFVTLSIAGILLFIELRLLILLGHYSYSAYYILWFCVINLVVLVLFKLAFYKTMRYLRKIGRNTRNVVIIADASAKPFIKSFIKSKDWGYRINAIICPDDSLSKFHKNIHVVDDQDDIYKKIVLNGIDDIFYCMPVSDAHYNVEKIIAEAEQIGISVHIMQEEFFEFLNENDALTQKFDNSFITHQSTPTKYLSLKLKELFDILFSAFVLVLTSPIMFLISLLIKLEDGGPIFFKQERVGQNGRRFVCFKFRSMIPNAETLIEELQHKNESDGPTFKIENDPRITKIGRLLRKTSLDEFPQFYNVLKGEMSVVGPRPPLLSEVKQYEKYQLRRLSMKPGITCIWQVSGRNSVSFVEWMKMDLDYIDNWSISLDVKIIIKTIGVIFKANGQ
jgi:exopolysaccharide biosynthesis polyprenyl glycosylphosphotransferase